MKKVILLASTWSYSQKLKLYDLASEHQVNPIGIETQKPRFSWKIQTSNNNVLQERYSIHVSETSSFSKNNI